MNIGQKVRLVRFIGTHGDLMKRFLGHVGTVELVRDDGRITVVFPDEETVQRWHLKPGEVELEQQEKGS